MTAVQWVKAEGYNVFIVPGICFPDLWGQASYEMPNHRVVNVFHPTDDPVFCDYLLLHEVAHHLLCHTVRWTSEPTWYQEWVADMKALDLLAFFHDVETVLAIRERLRDRFRPLLEDWIEAGITQHGEIDAAIWAGVQLDLTEGEPDHDHIGRYP